VKKNMLPMAMALGLAAQSWAGVQSSFGAGTQAATWLRLPNSARTSAMGEASIAVADDVNTLSVNPAGLAGLNGQEASLFHHMYVADTAEEHAAYGLSLGQGSGAALSFDYLNFGSVDKYTLDSGGNLTADGTLNPSGMAINLAYGRQIGFLDAGINVKMVSESLDGSSASGFAGDLGLLWRQSDKGGLSLGLAAQNLGTTLNGSNLPSAIQAGAAWKALLRDDKDALTLALDFSVPSADSSATLASAGAEYAGNSFWALRLGYKNAGNDGAGGLSLGAGLKYSIVGLDYAFVNQGLLGASNQVSLSAQF